MRRSLPWFAYATMLATATACSSATTVGTVPHAHVGNSAVRVNLVTVSSGAHQSSVRAAHGVRIRDAAPSDGVHGEGAPTSLKYYLSSLQICESLTTSGTAFNNPQGCTTLYQQNASNYSAYNADSARADSDPTHYLDLMSPTITTTLNHAVTSVQAGTYNYVIATWYRPIKVTGTITLASGSYYTHDGVSDSATGVTHYTGSFLTGPAQESVVELPNGGTWFKFQNPFVIAADSASYVLDLVFNPDRLLKGGAMASNASIQDSTAALHGIYVPFLDLSPVLHKASDSAVKESYVFTGPAQFSLRAELYYLQSDTTKTIYGIDFKTLYTTNTTLNITDPQRVFFVKTVGAETQFLDYQQAPMLTGFTRSATGGTVTVDCQTTLFNTDACGGQTSVTMTYAAPAVTTIP